MKHVREFAASIVLLAMVSAGYAQEPTPTPPKDAQKVSEIVAKIEGRPGFGYIESVEWEDEGYYQITYHTTDKAKVEIKIDAVTGQPRD
jgi:uncharacterized membrane protein YkoI